MTEQEQQHTLVGDWLDTSCGVGTIQHWGKWNGKRWIKSTRKRANGFYVYFNKDRVSNYIHRAHCKSITTPQFAFIDLSRQVT